MDVVASNSQQHGEGFENGTICITFQLVAFFLVEVAFATAKDVNLELGLEGPEVLYLGVIVNIKRESIDITKDDMDMSIRFGAVKGVAKDLFVGKS